MPRLYLISNGFHYFLFQLLNKYSAHINAYVYNMNMKVGTQIWSEICFEIGEADKTPTGPKPFLLQKILFESDFTTMSV